MRCESKDRRKEKLLAIERGNIGRVQWSLGTNVNLPSYTGKSQMESRENF